MVLCNVLLRRVNMMSLMRNVRVSRSLSSQNTGGISCGRIAGVISAQGAKYYSKLTYEETNLENGSNTDKQASKKKFTSPRITVLSNESTLTVMTLEEAQKLSKRRDLKLVKVMDVDRKTQRPVYKLMTGAQYFQEDLIRRKEKSMRKNDEAKDPKLLTLSANIGGHDLASKIKNIVKWLNKRHEVRIVINAGQNDEAAESICKTIETETKSIGKMVQKRKKGDDLKFQLVSLRKKDSDAGDKAGEEKEPEAVKTGGES